MKKTLAAMLVFVAGLLLLAMVIRWVDSWTFWSSCVERRDPSIPGCADVGTSLAGRLLIASLFASFAGVAAWAAFWLDADPAVPSARQDVARRMGLWAPAWAPGLMFVAALLGAALTSIALGGGGGTASPPPALLAFFSIPLALFVGGPVALVAWRVAPRPEAPAEPPALAERDAGSSAW